METNYLKPNRETVEAIIKIVFSEEYLEYLNNKEHLKYLNKIKELFNNKEYNKIIKISNEVDVIMNHDNIHRLVDLFFELNKEISYEKIIKHIKNYLLIQIIL